MVPSCSFNKHSKLPYHSRELVALVGLLLALNYYEKILVSLLRLFAIIRVILSNFLQIFAGSRLSTPPVMTCLD